MEMKIYWCVFIYFVMWRLHYSAVARYNHNLRQAIERKTDGLTMADVDRALFNSFKQRFDLGLFDSKDAYAWPTADDVGTDESAALSLQASQVRLHIIVNALIENVGKYQSRMLYKIPQESIVLLRNDRNLLPLPRGKRIAVLGPHANAQKVLVQPYVHCHRHWLRSLVLITLAADFMHECLLHRQSDLTGSLTYMNGRL